MNGKFTLSHFILLALLLCKAPALAQGNPSSQPKFPIGTYFNNPGELARQYFDQSGMNTIVWETDEDVHQFLSNYDLIAYNSLSQNDWICYYATSYYSKWEAEENQTDLSRIGIKHKYGDTATWHDTLCWSTTGVTSATDSLVYGPHYRQDKKYKVDAHSRAPIQYIPRYRMALKNDNALGPDEPVCRIRVTVRHIKYNDSTAVDTLDDTLTTSAILKVSDFPSNGDFNQFYFGDIPEFRYYTYPTEYSVSPIHTHLPDIPQTGISYADDLSDTGVEFWVEWLRDDTLCTLYIDNIEVYDYQGWGNYLFNPQRVADSIETYIQTYNSGWPNIKYWYGQDEPGSIDCYIPMKTVDSLVNNKVSKRVINAFYPDWRMLVNGDSQFVNYYRNVNPGKLMIDYYPFSYLYDPVRWQDLDATRKQLQIASSLDPSFGYIAQGFGVRDASGNWCSWRRPDSSELKATVMLALAHGAKGIIFWTYDSYSTDDCSDNGYFDCIVGLSDSNYAKSNLWYLIHNNLAPRLTGKLGDRLLG